MKKFISCFLCLVLIFAFATAAGAANENTPEELAESLYSLSLFMGTEDGFELTREPTRAEALVIMTRMMGLEKEALVFEGEHPFQDVPDWADCYVAFGYDQGYALGTGEDTFDPDTVITKNQFVTFCLRMLDYSDQNGDFDYRTPYALAAACGICDDGDAGETDFTRGDSVEISYKMLFANPKGQSDTVAQKLIEKGVFTSEELLEATGVEIESSEDEEDTGDIIESDTDNNTVGTASAVLPSASVCQESDCAANNCTASTCTTSNCTTTTCTTTTCTKVNCTASACSGSTCNSQYRYYPSSDCDSQYYYPGSDCSLQYYYTGSDCSLPYYPSSDCDLYYYPSGDCDSQYYYPGSDCAVACCSACVCTGQTGTTPSNPSTPTDPEPPTPPIPSTPGTGVTVKTVASRDDLFTLAGQMRDVLQYKTTFTYNSSLHSSLSGWIYEILDRFGDIIGYSISYSYGSGSEYSMTLTLKYSDGYETAYAYLNPGKNITLSTKNQKLLEEATRILQNEIKAGMGDYEKVKAIHDYMVLGTAYDTAGLQSGGDGSMYEAYGAVINKKAVCDGYAKAFKMFMDMLGIDCYRITGRSTNANHAWNKVAVDGKYYNIDVTFDDPVPDRPGNVSYKYFLISDSELKKDHIWTDYGIPAAPESYK